jgi:hypothetical protein
VNFNWNNYLGVKSTNHDGKKTTRFYIRTCPHTLPLPLATSPGWTFVSLCVSVSFCYLVPAVVYKRKRTGAKGLAALPHRTRWLQLYGLVLDGCQLCRSKAQQIVAGDTSGPSSSGGAAIDGGVGTEGGSSSTPNKSSKSKTVAKEDRRASKSGSKGKAKHSCSDKQKKGANAESLLDDDAMSVAALAEQQRMLKERRDQTVHSSMARVEVFTM